MRDNYVADIGDYLKYGLLKYICLDNLRLGLIWYYFPDEEDNQHGDRTDYLENSASQIYDSVLFAQLREIVQVKKCRTIETIEQAGTLPSQTLYYREPLSFSGIENYLERRQHRRNWFKEGLNVTTPCDVIYLDPDNGLECKKYATHQHAYGPKYVSYDEVEQLIQTDKTILIYQHVRQITVQALLKQRMNEIRLATSFQGPILSVAFKAPKDGGRRLFLFLPAPKHLELIQHRLESYAASVWKDFIIHCSW